MAGADAFAVTSYADKLKFISEKLRGSIGWTVRPGISKESRGGIPSMRNVADAESYETKFAWRQKEVKGIRNAADDETATPKQDRRESQGKFDVTSPGQTEFDVKYEHESVWTTKPKRDVDQTPTKKKASDKK